ncbi:MAG: hypothetical protein JW922_10250, partial [Paludibacteraceae bacterium]|nr:hypothetical protein [Paludibacteraceae bacterium]
GTWLGGSSYVCLNFYKDGGNLCKSNTDCSGVCLVTDKNSQTGKCSFDNLYEKEFCYFESVGIIKCYDPDDPWGIPRY